MRWLWRIVWSIILLVLFVWVTGTIWYLLPGQTILVQVMAALAAAAGLLAIVAVLSGRQRLKALPVALVFVLLAGFSWQQATPSNDRQWQADVARTAQAEIDGDVLTIRNVRNFRYRSERDFDASWESRSYRLSELDSLDLFAVYRMGDAIAHTILSFGFGDEYLAISIETRKVEGQEFSTIAGFFRQYTLAYVVADERDVIGLRTKFRQPPEDVYRYRIKGDAAEIRLLLLAYLNQINDLAEEPEFYNTLLANCTINIMTHASVVDNDFPRSWKILLSGYFAEYLYDLGVLDNQLSFPQLRAEAWINNRSNNLLDRDDYSAALRE